MMRKQRPLVVAVCLVVSSLLAAEEELLESRTTSVDLFKNGLAVINRGVALPAPGQYRIEDVPHPVHGTFWVESDAKVTTRLSQRVVEEPARSSLDIDFQEELAGREVVIHFSDSGVPPVVGKVVALAPPKGEEAWSPAYRSRIHARRYHTRSPWGEQPLLIVQAPQGRTYVAPSSIAYIQAKGAGEQVKRRVPVLLISVGAIERKPASLGISYLAKGIAWAPSYRIDLSHSTQLVIRQNAIIKNELADLASVTVRLISGFPSVQFGHVMSPLSLKTSWADFFQELAQSRPSPYASGGQAVAQQVVSLNTIAPGRPTDLSAIPTGEGVDLHCHDIGEQTIEEGGSLCVDIASATAPYERTVEWLVPDTRGADGRHIGDHVRRRAPEKYGSEPWDALRFKNPFPFPMTTAPAMVVANGRFNGQRVSYWANVGEETTVRITKALSVRTHSFEREEKRKRELVYVGSREIRKALVTGELWVSNNRKESIALVIRRRFSGDLVRADRSPKHIQLGSGACSVNRRNELMWHVRLRPGDQVKLEYRYSVLVRN